MEDHTHGGPQALGDLDFGVVGVDFVGSPPAAEDRPQDCGDDFYPRSTVPSTRVRAERRLLSPGTQLPSPKHWYRVPDLTTTSGRGIGATGIAAADTAELHLQWQKCDAYRPDLSRFVGLHPASAMASATAREGIQPERPRSGTGDRHPTENRVRVRLSPGA